MFSFFRKRSAPRISLEAQLTALTECGIRPASWVTIDYILKHFAREEFENDPYNFLISLLGTDDQLDGDIWRPFCDNLWSLDTECIEGHGAYAHIARRMAHMTDGELKFQEVRDSVNIEEGIAWLEYVIEGKKHRLDFKMNDDWMDESVVSEIDKLARTKSTDRGFAVHSPGDQTALLWWTTKDRIKRLNQFTDMKFLF